MRKICSKFIIKYLPLGEVIQFPLQCLISHEELISKRRIYLFYCFVLFLLLKSYLEAFYKFCKNHGDVTAEIMCPILEVRVLECFYAK